MFTAIPDTRPSTPLLDSIQTPADIRALDLASLEPLCHQLREYLLYSVGQSGGHLGAGLGVVELTVALHYALDTPNDKLVWDVGHQAYPHKILTNRRERMPSIRSKGGLAPFPVRHESEYDTFGVGHSSTSISAAMGMALGHQAQGSGQEAVAVIGDGAITAGMAFEALNHAGSEKANVLVVLNANDMSISSNVGGLNKYFTRLWSSRTYSSFREQVKQWLAPLPKVSSWARKGEERLKMLSSGTLFEQLGFKYYGPVDGHDVLELVATLKNLRNISGPRFLHVVTCKGKGFLPAEHEQIKYHALKSQHALSSQAPTYSNVFGRWLCDMAEQDEKLVGITPAMCEGSDMVEFSQRFPDRYHDVAIAEQHAVTLAAGLACSGNKPVVAIYSTFLQRAYDQLIHDVAVQQLDVLFAIDRAGLVGEDGATHQGAYDLSYLRAVPNMVVMTPSDEQECRDLLYTGFCHQGPAAVRYPRGAGAGASTNNTMTQYEMGKGVMRRQGARVALLVFGSPLTEAMNAAEQLDASVADMRFVKPLDDALVARLAQSHELLVTIEENAIMGGAGSAVLESLSHQGITRRTLMLGIDDVFIEHASPHEQRHQCGLDAHAMSARVRDALSQL